MKKRRSFSLSELLVVVAVILILVSLLIVSIREVYSEAQRMVCQHRLEQIGQACALFAARNRGRELRCNDPIGGTGVQRWYQKLLGYVDGESVEEARRHFNCPLEDAGSLSGWQGGQETPGGAGRGFYMPILLYASLNDSFYHNSFAILRDDFREFWPGGCDWRWFGCDNDSWIWNGGGLDSYGQFWLYGVDLFDHRVFQGTSGQQRMQKVRVFREASGGGVYMAGDHSSIDPNNYGHWNTSVNRLADYCEFGICNKSLRGHNSNVASTGHYIGNGITKLPAGAVAGSVGCVMKDPRHPERHPFVSFPIVCSGHQPPSQDPGGSGAFPGGLHPQPCGHIGVMDDGKGRVCVDNTFTRWGSGYYGSDNSWQLPDTRHNLLKALAQQIAVWLAGGAGTSEAGAAGDITYGYNNQIGVPHEGPLSQLPGGTVPSPRTTIRVLDYKFYEADHDGDESLVPDDDITCIAPRHGGRANVLFVDGHVESLTPEEIMDSTRNYWNVQK